MKVGILVNSVFFIQFLKQIDWYSTKIEEDERTRIKLIKENEKKKMSEEIERLKELQKSLAIVPEQRQEPIAKVW